MGILLLSLVKNKQELIRFEITFPQCVVSYITVTLSPSPSLSASLVLSVKVTFSQLSSLQKNKLHPTFPLPHFP